MTMITYHAVDEDPAAWLDDTQPTEPVTPAMLAAMDTNDAPATDFSDDLLIAVDGMLAAHVPASEDRLALATRIAALLMGRIRDERAFGDTLLRQIEALAQANAALLREVEALETRCGLKGVTK
jgi:hypothetical protein